MKNTFKKILFILIITFFIFTLEGCKKKTEETTEENQSETQSETEVQEASRNAPTPQAPPQPSPTTPPAAQKPPAAASTSNNKGGKVDKVPIKTRIIPDDRFLPIEFDTKEAALLSSGQVYGSKIRRNIFRDIKSDSKLRKDAENAINQARKIYEKVKNMPPGTYNEPLLKRAEETLKEAESAFRDQNYFKAKMMADKSAELANDSLPKYESKQNKPSVEFMYKGYYQIGNEKTAMITKKDSETGSEKLYLVQEGSIIADELTTPIIIELPDGSQIKVNKIEYKIEQINDYNIVVTNITESKPSFEIALSKPTETKTSQSQQQYTTKSQSTTTEAEKKPLFQSNTTNPNQNTFSGNSMKGF